jgi:tRNA 2-thiouridine synthesizing protein E
MISVRVLMKLDRSPLKRALVALRLDTRDQLTPSVPTDRSGIARFDLPHATGTVLVEGIERFQGRLDEDVVIELWSITQGVDDTAAGSVGLPQGSNAYPDMQIQTIAVDGRDILTDSEGYLVNPADWSESFARALAQAEGLALIDDHWEVIRYLRRRYVEQGTQSTVRDMVKHFRQQWGDARGGSAGLHRLFPRGGPQKQGNRLAGLLRTKGEH